LTEHHIFRVVGHVLVQERTVPAAAEELLEVRVGLAHHVVRLPHRLVILHADLHEPVLIDLGRDGDRVVRVQQAVAEIEPRQERVHGRLGRDPHDLLGVGEERAVEADRDRQRHTRDPTAQACFTISNWLCSPSATMYSTSIFPLAMSFAAACMTPSYGRNGYAAMTSTSARRMASAIASHPVASCSVSTSLDSRGLTSTAISHHHQLR